MSNDEPFYVVLRDDDLRLRRHDTRMQAEEEAKRLARVEPTSAFYVLHTSNIVGPIQPKAHLRPFLPKDADEIPF